MIFDIYSPEELTQKAKSLFKTERAKTRLDGWFIAKEKECELNSTPKKAKKSKKPTFCAKY